MTAYMCRLSICGVVAIVSVGGVVWCQRGGSVVSVASKQLECVETKASSIPPLKAHRVECPKEDPARTGAPVVVPATPSLWQLLSDETPNGVRTRVFTAILGGSRGRLLRVEVSEVHSKSRAADRAWVDQVVGADNRLIGRTTWRRVDGQVLYAEFETSAPSGQAAETLIDEAEAAVNELLQAVAGGATFDRGQ